MRILLTNDDGIEAYGLAVLYDIARALSDDVWVCAPVVEQSGKGRGVTLHDPLRVKRMGDKRFAVSGTPTDCVQIAVSDLLPSPPDLVLSGVNRGFNLAQDVTMSGTVAGAFLGSSLGIKAISLSQCLDFDIDIEAQWSAAKAYGAPVVSALLERDWASSVVMNVNFPDCPAEDVAGIEVTRQGMRDMHEMHAVKRCDPRGRDYYWMNFHNYQQTLVDGTDLKAIAENRISVTPLHLDLTHHEAMHALRKTLGGVAPKTVVRAGEKVEAGK
jgi:5'-nucleotidase